MRIQSKWIISLGVAGLLVSSTLWGKTVARSNTAQEVDTVAIPGEKTESSVFISAGPGLAMFGGNLGWAINFGVLSQVGSNRNLFYGLDAGFNFWNFNAATAPVTQVSTGATGIQLLPTLLYRFEVAAPTIFPYIGASAGPNIYLESQSIGNISETETSVFLELLLRPGFFTKLSDTVSLQVEGKVGILRSSFIFLPQANAVFAL